MKQGITGFIIGLDMVLVLALFVISERSCHESKSDRLSELEGQYEKYKKETEQERQDLEEEIKRRDAEIQGHLDRVVELEAERKQGLEKIKEGNAEIAALKKKRAEQTDKDEIIATQDKLILSLEYELKLEREDKAKVIEQRDNWAQAYFSEFELRSHYEAQLNRQDGLIKIGEDLNAESKNVIRKLKARSRIEQILIGGFIAYNAYRFFAGRK